MEPEQLYNWSNICQCCTPWAVQNSMQITLSQWPAFSLSSRILLKDIVSLFFRNLFSCCMISQAPWMTLGKFLRRAFWSVWSGNLPKRIFSLYLANKVWIPEPSKWNYPPKGSTLPSNPSLATCSGRLPRRYVFFLSFRVAIYNYANIMLLHVSKWCPLEPRIYLG